MLLFLRRRLFSLAGVALFTMPATVIVVLATPGSLRATRRNHNNDNSERRKTRGGGLSDREEKIAVAMEQEYYRLHPINQEAEEDEYERMLL